MKNKYIYILIAFLCFFGFNSTVNADYKTICQYKKGVDNINQSDCRNPLAVVTIDYDSENSASPYRIQEKRVCPDDDTGYHDTIESTFSLKSITAQKNMASAGGLGNRHLYFHSEMQNNQCPHNVIFDKYNSSFLCFYKDTAGRNWCADQSNRSVFTDKIDNLCPIFSHLTT